MDYSRLQPFCAKIIVVQVLFFLICDATELELPPSIRRPPSIIEQSPEVYYALPRTTIILQCSADAVPTVKESGEYYWKKDGRLFNISEENEGNKSVHILKSEVDGSLHFNGTKNLSSERLAQYAGKYQCFARNKWGTALSREIKLKIGTIAPYKTPADRERKVILGDSLEVPCHENITREDLQISWHFAPKTVRLSRRISQASDGAIIFSNVQRQDQGIVFYCMLKYRSTRSGTDLEHYTLAVNTEEPAVDRAPTIVRPKSDRQVALRGEEASLSCIATGKPTPSISWSRRGKPLVLDDDDDRFEIIDFNRTLHITNVKYEDESTYTCTATNDEGIHRFDVQLVVQAKPYFSDDTKRPTNKVTVPGETTTIRCEPEGKPEPDVIWMRNGKPINVSKTVIFLKDVTEDDTGVYQCIGKNKHGTMMAQGFLNVLTSPPMLLPGNKLTYRKMEGTSVDMRCKMFAAPPFFTNWTKTKTNQRKEPQPDLLQNTRITRRDDDTLEINNLNLDDSGTYHCKATNRYGSDILNITLLVLQRTLVLPALSKEIYYAKRGGNVSMSVEVFNDNDLQFDVSWYKDWYNKGSGIQLHIQNVQFSDAGKYEIVVETELDNAKTTIQLVVQDVPEKPSRLFFTADENDPYSGTLNWQKPFSNNSPIKSYIIEQQATVMHPTGDAIKNETAYSGDWEYLSTTLNGEESTAEISGLQPWVKYKFRVSAVNDIGSSKSASEPTPTYHTPPKAPRVNPTGVSGKGTSPDNMVIKWDPVDPLKYAGDGFGYEVKWCMDSNCTWEYIFRDYSVNSHIVKGTPPYTMYRINVTTANNEGKGPNAEVVHGYSGEDVPIESPGDVQHQTSNESTILISWKPVPSEKIRGLPTGYIITANDTKTGDEVKIEVGPNESQVELQLEPFKEYNVTVTVKNSVGESKSPSVVTIKTPEGVPLESPGEVEHQITNESKVLMSWKPVPPEKIRGLPTGYMITAKDTKTGDVVKKEVAPNETETELQLEPFKEYEIGVTVKNSAGESNSPSIFKVKTPEEKPDAPENFTAKKRPNGLELQWDEPSKVKGIITMYRITYKWKEGNETKQAVVEKNTTNLVLEKLMSNTTYNLTICAKTSKGYGSDCAEISTSTLVLRGPMEPKILSAFVGKRVVNLTWAISERDRYDGIEVETYIVQHRLAEKDTEEWISSDPITALSIDEQNLTIANLTPGTSYEFRIVAINGYGKTETNSTSYKTKEALVQKAETGIVGKLWFIVLLCIAALIVLIVVIACFMRRRKGGKYPVSEKEEQLVKLEAQPMNNEEYGKYSSANVEAKDTPTTDNTEFDGPVQVRLRGDSVGGNSIEVFGSGDTRDYDEDGSFIDQYGIDRRSQSKSEGVSSPASEDSKDISNANTKLLA